LKKELFQTDMKISSMARRAEYGLKVKIAFETLNTA